MSNKTDLQANNIDLQQILQAVQDLPQASHWSGGGTIIPGTDDVDILAYTDTALTVQGDVNLIFHINPYFKPGIQGTNYYGYIILPDNYELDFSKNGSYAKSTATTITFYEEHSSYPISGTYGWIAIA